MMLIMNKKKETFKKPITVKNNKQILKKMKQNKMRKEK